MANRREERERLRRERLAAQQRASSEERRRLMLGYAVAGVIVLAILVGIVMVVAGGGEQTVTAGGRELSEEDLRAAGIQSASGVINDYALDTREGTEPPPVQEGRLEEAAKAAGCKLRLDLPNEGNTHFGEGAEPPKYKTDPANSGDHINPDKVQSDGAYAEPVEPKYYVHSLEHGRVVIQYAPELPEEEQLQLKGVFDESPEGMLLSPNDTMDSLVAAAAWQNLLLCDEFRGQATLDAIRAFRDTFRGRGPEAVPVVLG
jgi:hypothetical protein